MNAVDEDFGEYGVSTYDIFSDEMKEYFTIDKVKGEIVTKIRLDREDRKVYEIPVIATDGGGRSGFTTVKVKVGDLNDNAPEFYLREYKAAISCNSTANSTFLKVNKHDNFFFVLLIFNLNIKIWVHLYRWGLIFCIKIKQQYHIHFEAIFLYNMNM